MFVKICGITRREDAEAAVAEGASALGFVFWPGSPRFIDPSLAKEIVATLPPSVAAVGVFVNQPASHVNSVASLAGLSVVQLHGDEDEAAAAEMTLPVIKAVSVRDGAFPDRQWPARVMLLIDADDPDSAGWDGHDRQLGPRPPPWPGGGACCWPEVETRQRGRGDRARPAVRHRRVVGCRAVAGHQGSAAPRGIVRGDPKGPSTSARRGPRTTAETESKRENIKNEKTRHESTNTRKRQPRKHESMKHEMIPTSQTTRRDPDARGYFGEFGGRFVPETLVEPVEELERAYFAAREDRQFSRGARPAAEALRGPSHARS